MAGWRRGAATGGGGRPALGWLAPPPPPTPSRWPGSGCAGGWPPPSGSALPDELAEESGEAESDEEVDVGVTRSLLPFEAPEELVCEPLRGFAPPWEEKNKRLVGMTKMDTRNELIRFLRLLFIEE